MISDRGVSAIERPFAHLLDAFDTPQERRKERQRRHIIEVATALFHENGGEHGGGLESTTAEMIAERADISTRTFFRYFDSKLDAVYLDYRRSNLDLMRLVKARLTSESVASAVLNASFDQVMAFTSTPANRERITRAFQSVNFAERRAVWQLATIRELVDLVTPYMRDTAYPEIKARTIVGLVRSVMNNALELWTSKPRQDLEDLLNLFLHELRDTALDLNATPRISFEPHRSSDEPVTKVRKARRKEAIAG